MASAPAWRRNQIAVTATAFLGYTGFTLVMPFLPLYIRQLGVEDVGEIALWSGLSLGATPAVTAVLSPFWGRVADRYGRKLMVQRALIMFTVTMAAMAMVQKPWHVFAMRAFQGLFAGYGGLTMAMAAESAPRERMSLALGLVQTAQRVGPALGPVIGGVVAGLVGLRASFVVTSVFYLGALIMVSVWYRDPVASRPAGDAPAAAHRGWRAFLGAPGFLAMAVAIFVLSFVDRSFGPILPLWIEAKGVEPARVALVSGIVASVAALGAVIGNTACDALLRRYASVAVIATAALGGAAALGALWIVRPVGWLTLAMGTYGLALGVATTAAYTAGGRQVPPEAHGEGFGYLNAGYLVGIALSPVAAGLLSGASLGWVIGVDLALLAGLALALRRLPPASLPAA